MIFLQKILAYFTPLALEDTPTVSTAVSSITSVAGSLITSVLGWLSDLTSWILQDPLALIGFVVAFVMLAIHVLHSLVKFSW